MQTSSADLTEQLLLENVLSLLVLLRALIGAVVLPAHDLAALTAGDISHHMTSGRHIAFSCFALLDVDARVEEVCFAVLAAEILQPECQLSWCARASRIA